jgi:hypothetical protein
MLKINTKVGINLRQGDNSINAACSAEFELSEDITEKERQSLEQVSKLIAKTAANTINETLKSNAIQKLPAPQPMKRINNVSGSGVKPASEKQISFMEFLCEKNHLDPKEVAREYGNVDSLSQMEYKDCDNFIKDHHKK